MKKYHTLISCILLVVTGALLGVLSIVLNIYLKEDSEISSLVFIVSLVFSCVALIFWLLARMDEDW